MTKLLLTAICTSVLFACSDNDNKLPEVTPPPPAPEPETSDPFVRVTHASPDAPLVNVMANRAILADLEAVDYQTSSGWISVPADTYSVQVDALLPANASSTVIDASLILQNDKTYDVVAIGATANIAPLVIENDLSEVTPGNVRLQVVHAAPAAPLVDVYVTAPGDDLSAAQPVATAAFMEYTGQVEVPAGDYQIRITTAGTNTLVYDSGTLSLTAGADLMVFATENVGAGDSPVTLLVADGSASSLLWDEATGANLRVVHGVANGPSVDVIANNEVVLVEAVPFTAATDYLSVTEGDYLIDVAANNNGVVVVDDASASLAIGQSYTAIANNVLSDVGLDIVMDNPRRIATAAQVRIFHASPGAGDVDIYVTTDGDIDNADPAFSSVPFTTPMLTETGYVQLAAGDYFVTVTAAGTKDAAIETGQLSLQAGSIYTAIAVDAERGGLPPQLILMDDYN
ncbi:DUF4397 domain-containing protein [Planctobacterium marinum]|uniref:DUF4397 domain-containing protein n=2 Tax=Planctobacterium marinum TaxID=1631968 RepID=UPI001E5CE4B3|nr:DUF4397 domain-containing protein [Planctobacterium marinum]MCC2607042.1 DUF4397 domain-containing protein [Planctobacterium marinum]